MIKSERNDHMFDYLIGSLKSTFPKRKGTQTAEAERTLFDCSKIFASPCMWGTQGVQANLRGLFGVNGVIGVGGCDDMPLFRAEGTLFCRLLDFKLHSSN